MITIRGSLCDSRLFLILTFLLPSETVEKRIQKFLYNFICCGSISLLHYFGLSVD